VKSIEETERVDSCSSFSGFGWDTRNRAIGLSRNEVGRSA